jgi:threonine dehydrogenase-like Zn-dependent dehydrogenase
MRAFQIAAPGSASLVETATCEARGAEEVRLRVCFIGLCGTDLTTYRGNNAMVTFPRIPGHEVAATVVEGGSFAPGTQVTLSPYTHCGTCASCRRGRFNACRNNQTLGVQRDGAMQEYITIPESQLFTAKLGLRELALVEPLTVGAHAAARGRVTAQDTVAVFGCGGVGLGAISSCAFRGARTIAIDLDDRKLEIARRAGASDGINTAREDLHERLVELTGDGPDVVIEAIGTPQTFRAAVEEVAFTGRVVYIGYAKEPVAYETRLFVQKELDILGSRNALPEDFREVIRMLEAGRFPVEETISLVIPPEDAAAALEDWSRNPGKYTKILVQFG